MKFCVIIVALISCSQIVNGNQCCRHVAGHSTCKQACQKTLSYGSARVQLEKLAALTEKCPSSMVNMWRCVNSTFSAIQEINDWNGRLCCDLALSNGCEQTCSQARSKESVVPHCDKRGSETAFYQCLTRQEGSQCCSSGTTDQCQWLCKTVILQESPLSDNIKSAIGEHCGNSGSTILTCLQNNTQTAQLENPKDILPCCRKAKTETCRTTCLVALQTKKTQREFADSLVQGCGAARLTDPLWQCFLQMSAEDNNVQKTDHHDLSALDGAKLHCCSLAKSYTCRESCSKKYSKTWMNSWNDFETHCETVPSEEKLRKCIEDVENPCKMGCDGLSYCKNFNQRPTEMFRSCNAQADKKASQAAALWQVGAIPLPQVNVPAIDTKKCKPELLQSITCALQIKPCHARSQTNKLCKSSCIEVLRQCLDSTNIQQSETLCNMLAPAEDGSPCVSLYKYLSLSPHRAMTRREISHPCNPNPCDNSHICIVNRRKCRHPSNCKPYVCRPGCTVGGMSRMHVSKGSYVLTPTPMSVGCYKLCRCGHAGKLNHCASLPCRKTRGCLLKATGFVKDHGDIFQVGCNNFVCFDNKIISSKRSCAGVTRTQGSVSSSTGLPCQCPYKFKPVCTKNGRTYPSACIARCVGVSDSQFVFGECMEKNPCDSQPCSITETCYPRRQTCLSPHVSQCRQYECIPRSEMCNPHHHDPICDTIGEEHTNLCILISKGRQPAYRGHCRYHCNMFKNVCGHNGETYPNECSALGSGTTVDYEGSCNTVGQYYKQTNSYKCRNIKCPPIKVDTCKGLVPPGGCCPICGGIIRMLYNKEYAVSISEKTKLPPLTVQNITISLQQHITTLECEPFSYLSIEDEVVVIVVPVTQNPTPLQVEACYQEARRIGSFIEQSSPVLSLDVALSPLLATKVDAAYVVTASSTASVLSSTLLFHTFSLVGVLLGTTFNQR